MKASRFTRDPAAYEVQTAVTARLLIDCVTKDEKMGAYQRIVRVGGPNLPGIPPPDTSRVVAGLRRRGMAVTERPRWTLSTDEAIAGILEWEVDLLHSAWGL